MKTKISKTPQYKFNRTLSDWKKAVQQACRIDSPRFAALQEIFTDILLDNHLHAVVFNRISNILSSEYEVVKKGETVENPHWLRKVIEWLSETPMYGYTVLEWFENDFSLIPRQNICPSTKEIILDISMDTRIGFSVSEALEDNENLLLFGDENKNYFGILHKAAPQIYYKRFAFSSWSEYIEKFGQPMHIAKTNRSDTHARDELFGEMERLGRAAFAVLDHEDDIQFVEASQTDAYAVFNEIIERCNTEISKLIQGQTSTTDEKSFTGAANVHERQANAITWNDKEFIANVINNIIFPFLKLDYTFNWVASDDLSIAEQWQIHKEMLALQLPIDLDYLSKKYNTPFAGNTGKK